MISERLRIAGIWAGVALAASSLGLLPGCSSDAHTFGNVAGSGQAGSANPGAGAGNQSAGGTSGAGAPNVGGGGSGASAGTASAGTGAGGSAAGSGPVAGAGGTVGAAGGQSGTICEVPPTAAQRKAPAFPATAITNPAGVLFRFMNNCPMTIWVKASNAATAFPGNNGVVQLASKATAEFDMVNGVTGCVEAYTKAAPGAAGSVQIQFTEMNAEKNKALNVNLSHVDWVGLPVEVKGVGTSPSCTITGCYHPFDSLLTGCPTQLLDTAQGKCHAPNWYCGAHADEDFCKTLMASATNTLNTDPDCAAGKGRAFAPNDVFGCAGFFGGQGGDVNKNGNACCAKVNRNYMGNATTQSRLNNCAFYKDQPYNVYAKWAHQQCPFIYAFAYDDVAEQSGFLTCDKGTEMDITYCPGDP